MTNAATLDFDGIQFRCLSIDEDSPSEAAKWIVQPDRMLSDLTDALSQLKKLCYPIEARTAPKYRLRDGVRDCRVFRVVAHENLWVLSRRLTIAQMYKPQIPFSNDIILAMNSATKQFRPVNFAMVLTNWEIALRRMRDWIRLEYILKPNEGDSSLTGSQIDLTTPHELSDSVRDKRVPNWDADSRTLSFGEDTRKFAPQTGNNVKRILDAFQEFGWRVAEDNPLPTKDDAKAAIRTINRGEFPLRFSQDGDRICWQEK